MKNSMKKVIALMLTLIMVLSIGAVATFAEDANAGGDVGAAPADPKITANADWAAAGTDENGNKIYEIHTAEDFLRFMDDNFRKSSAVASYKNATVKLCADIDLNPTWDATTKTTPVNYLSKGIFYMRGTFDGQGHTIKGLCIIVDGADNATMVTMSDTGTVFKNLNIENSYFSVRAKVTTNEYDGTPKVSGGGAAGLMSVVRDKEAKFENVYINATVEATAKNAGGFLSGFNATSPATLVPSATFTNCVFSGSVNAVTAAGGIVGSNDKPANNKGTGKYTITMTDCANYGAITSTTDNTAGGLVGKVANEAVFTRCFNAGSVKTALFNVFKTTQAGEANLTATVTDCYYVAGTDVVATTKSADAEVAVSFTYAGAAADAAKTTTAADLLNIAEFKNANWADVDSFSVPESLSCLVGAHTYGTTGQVVAPVKCTTDGYTIYTCEKCGTTKNDTIVSCHNYVSTVKAPTCNEETGEGYTEHKCSDCGDTKKTDIVEKLDHTPGQWTVTKEATTDKAGLKEIKCTACGKSLESEIIPKIAAPETEPETTAPETTAPETTAPETEAPAEDGGCGGSIAVGGMVLMSTVLTLGVATVSKKRK